MWWLRRFFVLLVGINLLVGCTPSGGDVPLVRNVSDYEHNLKMAEEFSYAGLKKYEQRLPLEPAEERDLDRARGLVESLTQFNPSNYAPFALKGKIELALGHEEVARQDLTQAVNLVPRSASVADKIVLAESHAELARLDILKSDLTNAEAHATAANALAPPSARYKALLARVRIQQKRIPEAKTLLEDAYKLDPTDSDTNDLIKLIKLAGRN